MANVLLFLVTVGIWGMSFFATTFQLGVVPLEVSVAYRFALGALIFLAFALATGRSLRFPARDHVAFLLIGAFLYSLQFVSGYRSIELIASGLTTLAFSTIVLFNIGLGVVFLKAPFEPRIIVGAALGVGGIAMVFWPDVTAFEAGDLALAGLGFAILSAVLASAGHILSVRIQRHGIPIVQINAFGMAYGAIISAVFGFVRGKSFAFDWSTAYTGSLAFLVIVSTVLGFALYLTLLGRIGAARAGYVWVLIPIVALAVSALFEGYVWTPIAAGGVAVVLLGNALVLMPRRVRVV